MVENVVFTAPDTIYCQKYSNHFIWWNKTKTLNCYPKQLNVDSKIIMVLILNTILMVIASHNHQNYRNGSHSVSYFRLLLTTAWTMEPTKNSSYRLQGNVCTACRDHGMSQGCYHGLLPKNRLHVGKQEVHHLNFQHWSNYLRAAWQIRAPAGKFWHSKSLQGSSKDIFLIIM